MSYEDDRGMENVLNVSKFSKKNFFGARNEYRHPPGTDFDLWVTENSVKITFQTIFQSQFRMEPHVERRHSRYGKCSKFFEVFKKKFFWGEE